MLGAHGVLPLRWLMSILPTCPPPSARGESDGCAADHVREIEWGFDRDYWLSRCQGFAVEDRAGRDVGIVAHVEYESRVDTPDFIRVRSGLLRPHTIRVAVGDIDEIWPAQRSLMLG